MRGGEASMRVTVFGAGNIGLCLACVLAGKVETILYTERPASPRERFRLFYEDRSPRDVDVAVTGSLDEAMGSDLLLCTYPAFLRRDFLARVAPSAHAGQRLGFVPGYGGAEFPARPLLERDVTVFGLQRVPYVARSSWSDREAHVLSAKDRLYVAAIPRGETAPAAGLLERLLGIPCTCLAGYLPVTLVPSNPLLHTVGSYRVLDGGRRELSFDGPVPFYAGWDDETSDMLLAFDDELQSVCASLAPLETSEVVSLRDYYESPDTSAMTRKLKSIKAFEAVRAPLAPCDDGRWRVDLGNRMFAEDLPFGVAVIKGFALLGGVETPVVDEVLNFYSRLGGPTYFGPDGSLTEAAAVTGAPQANGIHTLDELSSFYSL